MKYEYAFLGGGAAGLSLALELVGGPMKDQPILIVDKQAKNSNDRTWCYWTDVPDPLDPISYHVWPNLRFISERLDRTWELAPLRYQMVRGIDFYEYARTELKKYNVTFLQGTGEWEEKGGQASVVVDGKTYQADWVFDSRIRPDDTKPDPKRYNTLKQHFTGWVIESDASKFDPQTVTMFDFRTPQRGGITFFYILPFSRKRALVEYTLFSAELLPEQAYEQALKDYVGSTLGITDYRLESREHGIIPMTDQPFPRRLGKRVLAIGTRGGRVKPSTGYAFSRIRKDSRRIVHSLIKHGHPFSIPADRMRTHLFDRVILEVLSKEPQMGKEIFTDIFAVNPARRVLNFLDDQSTWGEDLRILGSPDPAPFFRGLFRLAGKVRYNFVSR